MAAEERCFTFVWKLENVEYCLQKNGEPLKSPAFVVDAIEGTKWNLWLYPRGELFQSRVSIYLHREDDSKGAEIVEIKFELASIGKDGTVVSTSGKSKMAFLKGASLGRRYLTGHDMIGTKNSPFLPNDILTLRCRIWKCVGHMREDEKYTVLTRIGIEKRSLEWNAKNFLTLRLIGKLSYQIKSIQNGLPILSVELTPMPIGTNFDEMILFDMSLQDPTVKFSTLRLFLVNSFGNRVECYQTEMWFDNPTARKQIVFTFTKKNPLETKGIYMPHDTSSFNWEWCFSKGVISERAEYGCVCSGVKYYNLQDIYNEQTTLLNGLVDNMKSLYEERFLSDVKLQTNTSEFPAHKFILSASSSVFKAMFSCDMKEKTRNCVQIEDLDDDTLSRMLLYIYTTRVEKLTCESASNLYAAADKYAILTLKNACSSFLKKNISLDNACEVLLLADSHADADLKSEVQEYIIKNGKQITKSEEWKALMGTNGKLAAETLPQMFK